jgi:hypothetical protein
MPAANDPIAKIKSWIYPTLVSILATIIWHDVNEIKNDVKQLMAQSNIDKTRIDNLERMVYSKNTLRTTSNPINLPPLKVSRMQLVAIKPENDEYPKNKRNVLGHL